MNNYFEYVDLVVTAFGKSVFERSFKRIKIKYILTLKADTNITLELKGDFYIYMKATGLVRRIDDLGRVVIPKEIRRTMRIREGDPLEIYTDREGEVIFKKYSPIGELQNFASEYADTLQKTASMPIFICDRDEIIAVSGASKKEYMERKISTGLEEIVERRTLYMKENGKEPIALTVDGGSHYVNCAMPILSEGDVIGCVISGWQFDAPRSGKISDETESKLIQTAGLFLGKQMEN